MGKRGGGGGGSSTILPWFWRRKMSLIEADVFRCPIDKLLHGGRTAPLPHLTTIRLCVFLAILSSSGKKKL